MLSLSGGELRIGLGRSGIAVLHSRGWLRRHRRLLDACSVGGTAEVSVDDLAAELDRLMAALRCRGLPARLVLADDWARSWIVTPPRNASRLADCQAATAARFNALYGEPLTAWQSAADWHARLPFLASALPQGLVTALHRVCADHRLLLLEIVPQCVAAWNRWCHALQAGRWFGLLQGARLTLGAVSAGRLCALRSLTLPAQAESDPAWLQQTVQREALRWMLVPPSGLQLCGALPAAWAMTATDGWACTRLDRALLPDGGAIAAGAASDGVHRAVQLAATGWR
jgi:hypothetical protein